MQLYAILAVIALLFGAAARGDPAANPECVITPDVSWPHGPEATGGSSVANLQCTRNGYIITVQSPRNIDEITFQLGSLAADGKTFVPSTNPRCTCTVPAPEGHPNCAASWSRAGEVGGATGGTGEMPGPAVPGRVTQAPLPIGVLDDIYARRKRSADAGGGLPTSTLTFEHGECGGDVDGGSQPDGYQQTVYLRLKEYFTTDNPAILLVTSSDVEANCDNLIVPPKDQTVKPTVEQLAEEVAVCRAVHFSIEAVALHDEQTPAQPEKIRVDISRDNLLPFDSQHSWLVKSLKYKADLVIGNHEAQSPLLHSIATRVENRPADVFRVETDYVVLESAVAADGDHGLPISAEISFRLHPDVEQSALIQSCSALPVSA